MTEPILEFCDIAKSFFGVSVLKNISFAVPAGHTLGLIGENGAGKSTLMNILGGVVTADEGKMLLNGKDYAPANPAAAVQAGIAFIHQELNLFTNLSIAENFFISGFPHLGKTPFLDGKQINARSREYLSQVDLKLSPDTLVEKLSPGERQLVEVAKAVSQDASIIIFDEPTTSLTNRETERLFEIIVRLQRSGKTVLYISHILRDVEKLADEIAILRDGELVSVGPKTNYTIQKMISQMVGREIQQLYPDRKGAPTGQVMLEIQGLSKPGIVHNIDLTLHKGEILGLFGLMGSGRTELAQMIFGLESYESGQMRVNNQPVHHLCPEKCIQGGMAFVTENRREEGLLMAASVSDNMGLAALPSFVTPFMQVVRQSVLNKAVKDMIDLLRVKVQDPFKNPAKGLSGGNQQKVVLGKWLMASPSILIVDEPTRGVDIGAKYEIYSIINEIADKGSGILFISSEIEELMGVCDRIIVMGFGEILGSFRRAEFEQEEILRTAFRENGK